MLYALYDSFGVKRMESSHLRPSLNRSNTFNKIKPLHLSMQEK